jgi:CRISPR-associated protein Cas5t
MLLSLVGESDRERHLGARVTAGVFREGGISSVLRTLWRIKDGATPQGAGENAKPDFQQLIVGSDLLVCCDSSDERGPAPSLEDRVRGAVQTPSGVKRFGGLSLGESTHLVNDIWVLEGRDLPMPARLFLLSADGTLTLPTWVDHVGSAGTRHAIGDLVDTDELPDALRVPQIPLPA